MTIALLTPVPSVHLDAARNEGMGTIALGTRATDVLREFGQMGGAGAPVLVYASRADGPLRLVVSWVGTFGEYRDAVGNGLVPRDWRRYRPRSMRSEDAEAGSWYGYFTVTDLRETAVPTPLPDLRLWAGDVPLSPAFVPHGPTIVVIE